MGLHRRAQQAAEDRGRRRSRRPGVTRARMSSGSAEFGATSRVTSCPPAEWPLNMTGPATSSRCGRDGRGDVAGNLGDPRFRAKPIGRDGDRVPASDWPCRDMRPHRAFVAEPIAAMHEYDEPARLSLGHKQIEESVDRRSFAIANSQPLSFQRYLGPEIRCARYAPLQSRCRRRRCGRRWRKRH